MKTESFKGIANNETMFENIALKILVIATTHVPQHQLYLAEENQINCEHKRKYCSVSSISLFCHHILTEHNNSISKYKNVMRNKFIYLIILLYIQKINTKDVIK